MLQKQETCLCSEQGSESDPSGCGLPRSAGWAESWLAFPFLGLCGADCCKPAGHGTLCGLVHGRPPCLPGYRDFQELSSREAGILGGSGPELCPQLPGAKAEPGKGYRTSVSPQLPSCVATESSHRDGVSIKIPFPNRREAVVCSRVPGDLNFREEQTCSGFLIMRFMHLATLLSLWLPESSETSKRLNDMN